MNSINTMSNQTEKKKSLVYKNTTSMFKLETLKILEKQFELTPNPDLEGFVPDVLIEGSPDSALLFLEDEDVIFHGLHSVNLMKKMKKKSQSKQTRFFLSR